MGGWVDGWVGGWVGGWGGSVRWGAVGFGWVGWGWVGSGSVCRWVGVGWMIGRSVGRVGLDIAVFLNQSQKGHVKRIGHVEWVWTFIWLVLRCLSNILTIPAWPLPETS